MLWLWLQRQLLLLRLLWLLLWLRLQRQLLWLQAQVL